MPAPSLIKREIIPAGLTFHPDDNIKAMTSPSTHRYQGMAAYERGDSSQIQPLFAWAIEPTNLAHGVLAPRRQWAIWTTSFLVSANLTRAGVYSPNRTDSTSFRPLLIGWTARRRSLRGLHNIWGPGGDITCSASKRWQDVGLELANVSKHGWQEPP